MWRYYDDRGLCTSFQSQDDGSFHQVFFFFFFFFAQEERHERHAGRPGSIDMVRGGACLRTQIYAVCLVSSGLPFLSMTPQPYWIAWRRRLWKVSPPVGDNLMEENDTKKRGSGRGHSDWGCRREASIALTASGLPMPRSLSFVFETQLGLYIYIHACASFPQTRCPKTLRIKWKSPSHAHMTPPSL